MLFRLFSPIVAILFVVSNLAQSHSAEVARQTYIPILLSKDQAIQYWKENCQNHHVNKGDIAERFSEFQFDYEELIEQGVDVLNFNDPKSQVFENISFNLGYLKNPHQASDFMNALAKSQIRTLILSGEFPNDMVEGFVKILEGGKGFKKVDMRKVSWKDAYGIGFFCLNEGRLFNDMRRYIPIHKNVKKIGVAATGKIDELLIDRKHSSTKYQPFDYHGWDPEKECNDGFNERLEKSQEFKSEIIQKQYRKNQILFKNMDRYSACFAGLFFLIIAYYLSV